MAEIAIPLIALGGMYVISNQKNKNKDNNVMKTPSNVIPWQAETVPYSNSLLNTNLNQTTDKFFSKNIVQQIEAENPTDSVGGGSKTQISLTGAPINKDNFKHNNMVPFFGAKIKGATLSANSSESILDNLQGQGSQQFRKREEAPLFKPHNNLSHANGAPNYSDFMQSRINPSLRMNNIKPWEEEKVAPGLGQGYGTSGNGGFNSGMGVRDAWLPKTVNELRVDTNPKMTYSFKGHEGPATSIIKESGTIATQGKVEKYLPDTYYTVGPERWFTTTGLEKAQTARGIEILQDVNRTTTSSEYYGIGKDGEATYAKGEYSDPKRPCLPPNDIMAASALGKHSPSTNDHGNGSYKILHNNRSTTKHQKDYGTAHGIIRSAIAPLLDIMRPSRKENVIGNLRPNGNANTNVSSLPIYNPADRTRTTIREMTGDKLDNNHLNVECQGKDAYLVSKHQPVEVQRDTTNSSYIGNAGPATDTAVQSYASAYNQRNNVNKTYINRPNHGQISTFNNEQNIHIDKRDMDRNNNRMWVVSGGAVSAIPSIETHGNIHSPHYKDHSYGCERINPDILSAFKENPYTQSLQSWA